MAKQKDPLKMTIPEFRQYLKEFDFPEEKCTDSEIADLREFLYQYALIAADIVTEQLNKTNGAPE
ncbi:MAG: hypothetical protein IKX67_08165 [Bacteroidales bacterium]|nr:hypothetical protein [Bacteroidales bacterium]